MLLPPGLLRLLHCRRYRQSRAPCSIVTLVTAVHTTGKQPFLKCCQNQHSFNVVSLLHTECHRLTVSRSFRRIVVGAWHQSVNLERPLWADEVVV